MAREEQDDRTIRVIVAATGALVVSVTVALWHFWVHAAAEEMPQLVIAIAAFGVLFFIGYLVINVAKTVQRLRNGVDASHDALRADVVAAIGQLRAIAPRVNYYSVYGPLGRAVLYEEAKKIIMGASHSLVLLNWSAEEAFDDDQLLKSRDTYFSLLEERSKHIAYTRVIQSPSFWGDAKDNTIGDSFEKEYVDHFRNMLAIQEEQRKILGRHRIELLIAPPTIPSTFLIADDNYLIWQLNEVGEPRKGPMHWQIRGAIVVYDPGGEIIKEFRATYDRAKGRNHRALEASDLLRRPSLDQAD